MVSPDGHLVASSSLPILGGETLVVQDRTLHLG